MGRKRTTSIPRGRATITRAEEIRGKKTARDRQMARQREQRKYLRGPIADADVRPSGEQKLDGLPDCAFVGERVRTFVAVSSWFWYCYPCGQPNHGGESDSRENR
jgi:hypothetical protein